MPTTTYTVTYSRTHRPDSADFKYTATISSTSYSTGWSAETLTATGETKEDAKNNLRELVKLAVKTNGLSDTFDVTT